MKSRVSLWLSFSPSPALDLLTAEVHRLAQHYGTPVFEPHVTLIGGFFAHEEDVLALASRLAAEHVAPELTLTSVASDAGVFTRILYAVVEPTDALHRLYAAATKGAMERLDPALVFGHYFPHLSLAYGDLSQEQVAILASSVKGIPSHPLVTTHLSVWRTPARQVESWEEIARFPFRRA